CTTGDAEPNPNYLPVLRPYDMTRGGDYYTYFGHTDVKELALYVEDEIKAGNWDFNLGMRGDLYNGLTVARQAEPRAGIAYNVKRTKTVLRVSYARTLETPFNENLVLSSEGCTNAVLSPLLLCTPGVSTIEAPGFRNEFHAGFQQAVGPHVVVSGEYIWKYTHNAFDFSVLGNTPITFPIDWHNSKIPGFAMDVEVPLWHNFSAYSVMSSVAARFFPPQVAGAGATVGKTGLPFRIDHDEKFNQTTHLQYQLGKRGPWAGGNWRFDSGQVAGAMPFAMDSTTPVDLSGLTNDEQAEAGILCGGVKATLAQGFTSCAPNEYSSSLIRIPAPGTANDDKNPPRIAPRNLFDLTMGQENIFRAEHNKVDLDVTAINVTNKYALYNFLSTFSGTHY
ncbi:MAG: TonB-dependent receptor, partial [Terriglobales bacterium]